MRRAAAAYDASVRTGTGPGASAVRGRVLSSAAGAVIALLTLPEWAAAVAALPDPRTRAAVAGTAALYALVCVSAVPLASGARFAVRLAVCLGALGLGAVLAAALGPDASWVLLFALAVAAALLPAGPLAAAAVPVVAAASVGELVAGGGRSAVATLLVLTTSTAAVALLRAVVEANAALRTARDEIAVLAAERERHRVARDLHDILGHSLTTVLLKAGVARRVLETTGDTGRAAAELAEVEELARAALADVRATVADYRTVTLAGELAAAASALAAAGIAADLPGTVDDVDPRLRTVFGYVVREAVTNAVRHSRASTVRVRLGRRSVEVADDGQAAAAVRPGSGLYGLAERMREAGGVLEVGLREGGGLRVFAYVPEEGERR